MLVEQLEWDMAAMEQIVRDKTGLAKFKILFQFDHSGNHKMMAPGALVLNRLKLSDGFPSLTDTEKASGVDSTAFRETTFVHPVTKKQTKQVFTYKYNGVTYHKGIQAIAEERGVWRHAGDIWVGGKRTKVKQMTRDEAQKALEEFPDFKNQKCWVEETIERLGHLCIFGPKFHCELAVIEYFWGSTKKITRSNCDYSMSSLREEVPKALKQCSDDVFTIRRQYEHVFRYMQAYRMATLSDAQVEWAMRKYTSHRRIKGSDVAAIDKEFLTPSFMNDMPEALK
jgi:hypothetical protein